MRLLLKLHARIARWMSQSKSPKTDKELMMYRGVPVGSNMSKDELVEVIQWLASELMEYKGEYLKYERVINIAKVNELVRSK